MRVICITFCVLGVLVAAAWSGRSLHLSQRHRQIMSLLQHQKLSEARTMLNGYHDWNNLLSKIERAKDPTLTQAAFDVQFEYWYSEADDTNYAYSEQTEVVHRLLALGARPQFGHLCEQPNRTRCRWPVYSLMQGFLSDKRAPLIHR